MSGHSQLPVEGLKARPGSQGMPFRVTREQTPAWGPGGGRTCRAEGWGGSTRFFILDMFIQVFMFFFDRFLIILGGEGGCLDWFFIRLLTRDPPSEVCSMQR